MERFIIEIYNIIREKSIFYIPSMFFIYTYLKLQSPGRTQWPRKVSLETFALLSGYYYQRGM